MAKSLKIKELNLGAIFASHRRPVTRDAYMRLRTDVWRKFPFTLFNMTMFSKTTGCPRLAGWLVAVCVGAATTQPQAVTVSLGRGLTYDTETSKVTWAEDPEAQLAGEGDLEEVRERVRIRKLLQSMLVAETANPRQDRATEEAVPQGSDRKQVATPKAAAAAEPDLGESMATAAREFSRQLYLDVVAVNPFYGDDGTGASARSLAGQDDVAAPAAGANTPALKDVREIEAADEAGRPRTTRDALVTELLIERFLDEIKPWAFGLAGLVILGYAGRFFLRLVTAKKRRKSHRKPAVAKQRIRIRRRRRSTTARPSPLPQIET